MEAGPTTLLQTQVVQALMEGDPKQADSKAQKPDEAAASLRAWRAWRSKHRMPLEEALKIPEAWHLYKEMLLRNGTSKVNLDSYDDWLSSTQCTQRWVEWKRLHPRPLREVLADPEGWKLFCAMKQEKGASVPPTYEEWMQLQEQRRSVAYDFWVQWRRQHPGPLVEVLADPEGWALYKAKRESHDAKLPETHAEWCRDPNTIKAMTMEAWTTWRRAHPGTLRRVLADPAGYELYRQMLEASGKQTEPTYEQWKDRKATSSWQAWRREHPGPLVRVLEDPLGWQLYRNDLELQRQKNGSKEEPPATFEEWLQLPHQQRLIRKEKPSVPGESEGKKAGRVKGRANGNITKGKSQQRAAMDAWLSWFGTQPAEDLVELLRDPEGWKLYIAAMSKPRRPLPETYEAFRTLEEASKAWAAWREEHHGPVVGVVKDPEGWRLYSALMRARGVDIPATAEEWLQLPEQRAAVAALEWVRWREEHPEGPLLQVLGNDEEGWKRFRAFMQAIGTEMPVFFKEWEPEAITSLSNALGMLRSQRWTASRRIEGFAVKQALAQLRGEPFASSFEEWVRTPNYRRNTAPPSWKLWRRRHPGPLAEVLKDQEGWNLYVRKLQMSGASVPATYEEWIDSPHRRRQEATMNWTIWRKNNKGPMLEVLQDPEGWKLYSAMKEATGGSPCEQFEEWQNSAGAKKKALREWLTWKKAHPGPRYTILSDPLGWRLYRAAYAGQRSMPETYQEYIQSRQPTIAWLEWRRLHQGPLVTVLADEDGWQVYKEHMQATGKTVPEDFAEWVKTHRAATSTHTSKKQNRAVSPQTDGLETQCVAAE